MTQIMSVPVYRRNLKWLKDHTEEYPHQCSTKGDFPNFDVVSNQKLPCHFIRVPLPTIAVWGFETEGGLKAFKELYVTLKS